MRIALLIALALVLSINVQAAAALAPNMNLVLTKQDPFPTEPGSNMNVEVEIQNNGKGEASGVAVELITRHPFSLLSAADATKAFSNIGPSSSVKATYSLHVDEAAVSGSYDLEFRLTSQGTTTFLTKKVNLTVQGEAKLVVDKVTLSPENIEAGGMAEMLFFVRNVGTGKARQVVLELNSTPEIIPLFSEGVAYVGDIPSGESAEVPISVSIGSNAEQKTYVMKLTATYKDESGTSRSSAFDIGIPVVGVIRLDVIKTEARFDRGLMDVEVANKGTAEAKSVEARLVVGGETVDIDYISQIKPNKKTTFSFPLVAEGSGTLQLSYIGPGLESNLEEKELVFGFTQPATDSTPLAIVAVIIIAAVAVYFWKFRKKK